MKALIAALAALTIAAPLALAGHSLEEGHKMIAADVVYRDQLVVKLRPDYPLDVDRGALAIAGKPFRLDLPQGYRAERLFKSLEATFAKERALRRKGLLSKDIVDLSGYIAVRYAAPLTKAEAKQALTNLYRQPEVEFAHFESHIAPAVITTVLDTEALDTKAGAAVPRRAFGAEPTPDFQDQQNYLEAAPRGVDAFFGWQQPGGDGKGVHVVDIEFGWHDEHEDLNPAFWEREPDKSGSYKDHGTAVWGVVAAKKDGKGITGIAHGATVGTATYTETADAFIQTAERLKSEKVGVMIIELQRRGPDSHKWAPWEYWQEVFDAFKKITGEYGIHIIEAAGNGNSNLDSPAYEGAFDLSQRDSGAVLVGAGGPAGKDTHLKRLDFSNYGSRIDSFGYGMHVTTTGYGDLFGKGDLPRQYTAKFAGTSSATPIVTGAVVSVLGMALEKDATISVATMRKALRATGTKQQGTTSERIGNLPDIAELVEHFDSQGWR